VLEFVPQALRDLVRYRVAHRFVKDRHGDDPVVRNRLRHMLFALAENDHADDPARYDEPGEACASMQDERIDRIAVLGPRAWNEPEVERVGEAER
jgi:hypothetical protein